MLCLADGDCTSRHEAELINSPLPQASNIGIPVTEFGITARSLDPYDDYCLGCQSVVRGRIKCSEIEGDHVSILEEPAVRLIGEKLNARLRLPKL